MNLRLLVLISTFPLVSSKFNMPNNDDENCCSQLDIRFFSNSRYCKSVKFITSVEFHQTDDDVNQILKSIKSSNVIMLNDYNNVINSKDETKESISSSSCYVIVVNENKTLDYITSLFEQNDIIWNYETQILVICKFNCSINNLLSNFYSSTNSDNLINAVVMDFHDNFVYHACASSNTTEQYQLLEILNYEQSNLVCRVDLHNQVIPAIIYYNPPMTQIKKIEQEIHVPSSGIPDAIINFTGLEPELLRAIMKAFNFNVEFKMHATENTTNASKNNDVRTALTLLNEGEVKMMINLQYFRKNDSLRNVTFIGPIYREKSCLVVDQLVFQKGMLNIYQIFRPSVYIALILVSTSVAFIWIIITKFIKGYNGNSGSIVMTVIYVMQGGNVYK